MTRSGKALRYAAFGWMVLVGVLGGLFVAGETFDDPGGWAAAAVVASWLVPLVALAWFALARPTAAQAVFIVATLLVATFTLADAVIRIIPRDDWGPVSAITVFALGVALGFLGLRRPSVGGTLLVMLAVAQLASGLLEGRGNGGLRLGGSSGAVVVPILVGGVLFLLAGHGRGSSTTASPSRRHVSASR